MKTITFICPYFGKLPNEIIPLWLISCKHNPSIQWILFIDDTTEYKYPDNVKVVYTTLENVKNMAQKEFEFKIYLDNSYKLCDYKPLYGLIFKEWLVGVDFWGHCDISDCIYGDLRKYFTRDVLNNSEKILFLGHMTLYKNTHEINNRFRIPTKSGVSLEEIFSTSNNMAFDELKSYSINSIYMENNFKITRIDDMYVDLGCLTYRFVTDILDDEYNFYEKDRRKRIFLWDKGKLYENLLDDAQVNVKELGYIHFQKRKMSNNVFGKIDKFYIFPDGFHNYFQGNLKDIILNNSKNKLIYTPFFKYKYRGIKLRIKTILSKIIEYILK